VVRVNKPVALLRLVSAAVLSLPLLAQAAGLGRLSVQSFLGQPLRAEIEIVSVQAGEESSLEARLASGNAFAQAGIEFNPALTGIQFILDKRDGRPIIRVSTRQPVNEPFVDLLVELRWATGLFVREYTVLLDPPGYEGPKAQPMAAAPVATPAAAPVPLAPAAAASSPAAPTAPAAESKPAAAAEERPLAAAPAAEPRPSPPSESKPAAEIAATPAPAQATPGGQTYEVKKGDTLGEIALQYRPQGVTFHQMLIALQRANEDAFISNNVNLVRAGRILNIPDAEAAAAVDGQDANRLVIAQHADFAEYRSRLGSAVAAAPAAAQAAERSAAGPITAKTDEPKPAPTKDQLKLSKADPKKPGAPAARAAREDDLAARERALQEAQSRVTELEKNVGDLQKLLEIRNQQLKQLQDKATAKPAPAPAVAPAAKAPEPPKPTPAPQAASAPEAKPAAPIPAPAPAAPEAAKPAAPEAAKPVPPAPVAVRPRPVAPPPPPAPSLIDELLDNPIGLPLLGGVILLLIGYGAFAWQRKKKSVSKFQDSVLGPGSIEPVVGLDAPAPAPAAPSSMQPSSVSQAPVGGMGTDDVDPIAEADVYMAYGRDAQAEEILKEALQKDPNRVPVMAKLLEIYANRRDAQSFEQIAVKLKGATRGAGPEWDKATALGRNVDPGNGLYGGSAGAAPAAAAAFAATAALPAAAAAPSVDFDIGGGTSSRPALEPTPALDLDLGGASEAPERTDFAPSGTLVLDSQESKAASGGLDFDLGGGADKPADSGGGLNFELPGAGAAAAPEETPSPAPASSGGGLDFDLNLGGSDTTADAPTETTAVDLSAISLDLGTPGEAGAGTGDAQADPKWQEVATKLDLAKAYEEMGDKDGARELLGEVLREGDAAQQGQANQLLAKLS
jgi:pilus assembly protein FimV